MTILLLLQEAVNSEQGTALIGMPFHSTVYQILGHNFNPSGPRLIKSEISKKSEIAILLR
jgi:hypothetical protein